MRALALGIFAVSVLAFVGCADPLDDTDAGPDASTDAGFTPDAEAKPDAGEDPPADAGTTDAGAADAGEPDAGEADAGTPDSGPRVVPIVVAYAATVEQPLLAELFLTESSTTRAKITPALAGGPPTGGKGEPIISGVERFGWTRDGDILYAAQQDNFDLYEIYLADDPGSNRFSKLSLPSGESEVRGWETSPGGDWITFAQAPAATGGSQRYVVPVRPGASPVQVSMGSAGIPFWSPTNPELAFQDIIVSASDRDLWHVNLATTPPTRTRAHTGANLGFGSVASWSPDGTRLAFSADDTASRVFEPWQVEIRSGVPSAAVRLTAAFGANADITFGQGAIQYDPTGSKLAFIADTDTDNLEELFVLDPTGALPAATTKLNLAFGAGADGVDRFSWSSDGARILYVADHASDGVQELYITAATGPTGLRINTPILAGGSVAHEAFIRGDDMVIYTQYEDDARRLYVAEVSGPTPGAPVDLGPIHPFFPSAQYEVSPSEDYVIFHDLEDPPQLHLARLTGTPTVTASFDTLQADFAVESNWCWGPQDELLVIKGDGQLYLVEDLDVGDTFLVSGPLAQGGRVTSCRFPPLVEEE